MDIRLVSTPPCHAPPRTPWLPLMLSQHSPLLLGCYDLDLKCLPDVYVLGLGHQPVVLLEVLETLGGGDQWGK